LKRVVHWEVTARAGRSGSLLGQSWGPPQDPSREEELDCSRDAGAVPSELLHELQAGPFLFCGKN